MTLRFKKKELQPIYKYKIKKYLILKLHLKIILN